jgi:hypothetical protein
MRKKERKRGVKSIIRMPRLVGEYGEVSGCEIDGFAILDTGLCFRTLGRSRTISVVNILPYIL